MKALVYGKTNIDKSLLEMLKTEGIETHKLRSDFITTTDLSVQDKYDLAIVDSRSDNANQACRYIRENWDIPLVLVVDSLDEDWKRLKPIEVDGYIPDINNDRVMSARSKALLRRLMLRNKHK